MARGQTYEEAIRLRVEATGDKELDAVATNLSKLAASSDKAAGQAQELIAELEKLASVSNSIRGFVGLKASLTETGTKLGEARQKMAALGAEFDRAEAPSKKLQASLAKAGAEVANLTKQQNRQQAELTRTGAALRAAGVDTDKLGAAAAKLAQQMGGLTTRAETATSAMTKAGRESGKAADGLSQIERASKGAGAQLANISTRLTAVAATATAALGALAAAGTAAFFTGAIRSAATLEDALTQVRAVTGATAEQMGALKKAAEEGGKSTRFSTLQAAQGLGELARASGDAQTAIEALPATLNLAAGAGLEVADAANIVTTTLTQFGLGFENATKVADLFVTEANSTQDTVAKLGLAMGYTAPLAAALGMTLEDTTAVIGALATTGFRGEKAGTALRNAMSAMLDPASEFSKALRDAGIESSNFGEVIVALAEKGQIGRDAILKLDAEATPAILQLAGNGSGALRELQAALANSGGAAKRTAEEMRESLGGATESITDSFDRTRRSLVEPLLEPLQKELAALADELETFAGSPEFEEIKGALKTLFIESAAAARDLIESIDFKAVGEQIRAFATDSDGSLTSFKENLGEIADAVKLVGDTVSLVFNMVQTVIFAVAGVVTKAVSLIAQAIDTLNEPTRKVLEFLGILEEGPSAFAEFGGGMDAVSAEFAKRMVENFYEADAAAKSFGEGVGAAGESASAGLGKSKAASDELAAASKAVATGAAAATAALDGQAKGATDTAKATTGAADQMAIDADRLKKAFADMGIQSQQELGRAADSAKRNFDLIRQAVANGTASADDANRAFAAYAAAARAAVADGDDAARQRVENELEVQAAIAGTTAALKRMGNVDDDSKKKLKDHARGASVAILELGDAATGAAGGVKKAADETEKAGDNMRVGGKEGQKFALSLFEVSEKANEAYSAITRLQTGIGDSDGRFVRGMNDLTARIKNQGDAIAAQVAELQAANAEFDELAGRRKELAQQYDLLGAGEIEKLLQAEVQLEANRQRAADKRKGDAEQAARATAQAAEAQQATAREAAKTAEAAAAPVASMAVPPAASGSAPIELVLKIDATGAAAASALTLSPAQIQQISRVLLPMLISELERRRMASR